MMNEGDKSHCVGTCLWQFIIHHSSFIISFSPSCLLSPVFSICFSGPFGFTIQSKPQRRRKRMRKLLHLKTVIGVAMLGVMLLSSVAVRADDLDNITFHGVVRDSTGAAVVSAHVTVVHTATGVERASETDSEGRYRITVNAPGNYKLKVVADGFRATESQETSVTSGRVVAMDFALQPSGVSEQVTVTASNPPLVDTTRTVTGDTITRRELDELPIINRDPL